MFRPEQFRAKAAQYAELVKASTAANDTRDFEALEQRFTALADNEQWLADNYEKTLHGADSKSSRDPVGDDDDLILRCLGAALVMQWSTLPTEQQKELFNNATAVGELAERAARKGMIARFLHKQKDTAGNEQSKPPCRNGEK